MPVRGWYPDPDQTPGRFRFWNGSEWTANTTDNGGPPQRSRKNLAILVVVLLLIVAGTIVAVHSRTARTAQGLDAPSSSRSGWDDSSPSPAPSGSPSPASASPSPSPSARPPECDQATSDELGQPPADGRVHGGPLSFRALAAPWTPAESTSRFPFSRDSQMQRYVLPEQLPWQASAQVGVVAFDHYPGRHVAAERMLNCLLTSDFYSSVHVTVAYSRGSELEINGTPASQLNALLTFSHPQLKTKGSLIRIIVVDTSPATYYFHAVPRERRDLITALDRATSSLSIT